MTTLKKLLNRHLGVGQTSVYYLSKGIVNDAERQITAPLRDEIARLEREADDWCSTSQGLIRDLADANNEIARLESKVVASTDESYDAVWNAVEIVRLWVREQDDMDSETTIGQITDAFGGYMATGSPERIRTRPPRVDAPAAASEPESNYQGILSSSNGDESINERLDVHMHEIIDLDKRLTQVTNSFTGHREWAKTEITNMDKRVKELTDAWGESCPAIEDDIDTLNNRITALEGTDDPEYDEDTPAVSKRMAAAASRAYKQAYGETHERGRWKIAIQAALAVQGRRELADDEVERVAIAIYVASGEHVVDASAETWKDYHPMQQEDYRRLAKAALVAQGRREA